MSVSLYHIVFAIGCPQEILKKGSPPAALAMHFENLAQSHKMSACAPSSTGFSLEIKVGQI
jgi:hypothetical protein